MRGRNRTRVIMWLEDTFLESILNRKVIVHSGSSGGFTELLFDCLLNAVLMVIGLYHHHFA